MSWMMVLSGKRRASSVSVVFLYTVGGGLLTYLYGGGSIPNLVEMYNIPSIYDEFAPS